MKTDCTRVAWGRLLFAAWNEIARRVGSSGLDIG
jgi:hypothetical protein